MSDEDLLQKMQRLMLVAEHKADQTMEPWHRLVGRVRLQESEFLPADGDLLVLNLEEGGLVNAGDRVTRVVCGHPAMVARLRAASPQMNDWQRAAWVAWRSDVQRLERMV